MSSFEEVDFAKKRYLLGTFSLPKPQIKTPQIYIVHCPIGAHVTRSGAALSQRPLFQRDIAKKRVHPARHFLDPHNATFV